VTFVSRVRRVAPPRVDAALAAIFVAMTIAESLASDTERSPFVHALLATPALAALAWRRRFPIAVAAAVVLSNLAVNPAAQFSTLLALVLVSFTVGSETEPPRSWAGLALILLAFLAGLAAEGLEPSDVAAAVMFLVGPFAVGVRLRQRSLRAQEAIERVEQLEREREAETAAAAAAERDRIARELHDIVSHSISVIAIQTQAVRRRLGPEQRREQRDLAAVETTARQALAEMRRLFGVLRADDSPASLAPQPGLGELERLLEQVRAAGLPVDLTVVGEPAVLPPGVDLAAYRIVQEGLTNALRHAHASQATVVLEYGDSELLLAIEDDGRGPVSENGGHGLLGVRERVALYGGAVEAGARSEGGFRLRASLPVRESR
jgi:signal transduction histidine kinase